MGPLIDPIEEVPWEFRRFWHRLIVRLHSCRELALCWVAPHLKPAKLPHRRQGRLRRKGTSRLRGESASPRPSSVAGLSRRKQQAENDDSAAKRDGSRAVPFCCI